MQLPAQLWFAAGAIFHYLGPSLAALLFPAVGVLGVAWIRIMSAGVILAPWSRPWALWRRLGGSDRALLCSFGTCLAVMNCAFYLALDRLPLSLVAAIEFAGVLGLALFSEPALRNVLAVALAAGGVYLLLGIHWASNSAGLLFAVVNAVCFVVYVLLGHKISRLPHGTPTERLGLAIAIASALVLPLAFASATLLFRRPILLLFGIGVGICSSVIPYLCDQLAMRGLARGTYALMLALLPVSAMVMGALILRQIPTEDDLIGGALVVLAIAVHRPRHGYETTEAA